MSRLSRSTRTELLRAWEAWDAIASRAPKRPPAGWLQAETARKDAALKRAAGELGRPSTNALWGELVAHRRGGASYEHCIDAVTTAAADTGEPPAGGSPHQHCTTPSAIRDRRTRTRANAGRP